MGWLSDKLFGKKKTLDVNKIKEYLKPTQNFINQQSGFIGEGMGQAHEMFGVGRNMLGMGQEFMDPNSQRNVGMRGLLQQIAQRQASDHGAQIGSQMMRMGAMSGVSPGQAMMQSRMAQNQAMGGVGQGLLQSTLAQIQGATQQGIGLMGQGVGAMGQGAGHLRGMGGLQQGLIGMQQGVDENLANAYIGNINAHNANRAANKSFGTGLLTGGLNSWNFGNNP